MINVNVNVIVITVSEKRMRGIASYRPSYICTYLDEIICHNHQSVCQSREVSAASPGRKDFSHGWYTDDCV